MDCCGDKDVENDVVVPEDGLRGVWALEGWNAMGKSVLGGWKMVDEPVLFSVHLLELYPLGLNLVLLSEVMDS